MSNNRKDWWAAFNSLPRYSFIIGQSGGVNRVGDRTGNWIEQQAASALVDSMQDEINALHERLDALKPQLAHSAPESAEAPECKACHGTKRLQLYRPMSQGGGVLHESPCSLCTQPTGAAEVERTGPFHISISGDHATIFPQAGIADVVAFADWLDERLNCGHAGKVGCYDCGRPYGDEHGFPDLVVPHDVWAEISPTGHEGGLLCPSCICKRAHAAGIASSAAFRSGPFAEPQPCAVEKGSHPWELRLIFETAEDAAKAYSSYSDSTKLKSSRAAPQSPAKDEAREVAAFDPLRFITEACTKAAVWSMDCYNIKVVTLSDVSKILASASAMHRAQPTGAAEGVTDAQREALRDAISTMQAVLALNVGDIPGKEAMRQGVLRHIAELEALAKPSQESN